MRQLTTGPAAAQLAALAGRDHQLLFAALLVTDARRIANLSEGSSIELSQYSQGEFNYKVSVEDGETHEFAAIAAVTDDIRNLIEAWTLLILDWPERRFFPVSNGNSFVERARGEIYDHLSGRAARDRIELSCGGFIDWSVGGDDGRDVLFSGGPRGDEIMLPMSVTEIESTTRMLAVALIDDQM